MVFSESGEYLNNEFVKDFSLGFHNIEEFNNYEVFYKGKQGGSNNKIINHNVIFKNKESDNFKYYFDNSDEFEIKLLSIDSHFMINANDLFFHFPFKNVIYQYVGNEFKQIYEINIADRLTPYEVFKLNDYEVFKNEYFESTKYYHMWTCLKVSNHYFIIPIFNSKKVIGNIWIDRRNNNYYFAKEVTIDKNSTKQKLPLLPRAVKGDTIITINGFINTFYSMEDSENDYISSNPTLTLYLLK